MEPWKTLERTTFSKVNEYLTVEQHRIELPDGTRIDDWPWLVMPDFANVLARTGEGKFLCFRQPKYAVEGLSLAPPGGLLEPEEAPLEGVQRELVEETGYRAKEWISLGSYAIDANRGAGRGHFFLALEAHYIREPEGGDLEEQELLLLGRDDLDQALDRGEFKVMPWAACIALGLRYLDQQMKDDSNRRT